MSRRHSEHLPFPTTEADAAAVAELFARAESSAHFASYVWHLPTGPVEWSEQFFRLLGLDPLVDKADVALFLSFVHPDDVGKMPNVIEELRAGARTSGSEHYRIRRRDGDVRDVISRWAVIHDDNGSPEYLYGTLLDVTDALLENDRLTRTLDELDRAQRLANMGSWHWDVLSNRLEWSAQLYRILGYEPTLSPTREAWLARIHPEDAALVGACDHWSPSERGQDIPPTECRVVRPDGEVRWVTLEAETVFDPGGRPLQVRGVVLDVTDRRLLEERLRASTQMEAVGRLAGGVAHDFNNLLTIVQANVDRLRLAPDMQCLDSIETAVRTASDLTQRLLTFSRQAILRPRVLDLNRTVADVLALLRGIISPQIRVELRAGSEVPSVRLDESQMHQVLINLITNARDAMPDGGQIVVETERVVLGSPTLDATGTRALPAGAYAVLSVRDSGTGMASAVRTRMFEPFFTTKPPGQGTGLGLATVFGIVSQSGGALEVDSAPNCGSCFRVYFPAVDDVVQVTGAPRSAPPSSVRVLLVEDNDLIREPITFLLRDAGYDVYVAASAAEARQLWAEHEHRFDVLMTDIVMPGDSGTVLANDLRSQCEDLRVLFMTGYVNSTAPRPDARTEILQKPFRLHVPLEALQRLMTTP